MELQCSNLYFYRSGRCALVTSFGIFKYMAAYSLTMFVAALILYTYLTNLNDIEYLYIDLFVITVFAALFGLTKPYEGKLGTVGIRKPDVFGFQMVERKSVPKWSGFCMAFECRICTYL